MDPALDLTHELALALDVADTVDAYTLPNFHEADFDIDWKHNRTEVTEIDRRAETMIVERLLHERPHHNAFGEEHGTVGDVASPWQWVIDPIDGTKNFVRGVPVWASLIALLQDGVPVVGVVSAPALNRRWWAGRGLGAYAAVGDSPPRTLSVSRVGDLASASLSFSSLSGWAELGLRDQFVALTDAVWRVRGYGDFFSYCLVAEGAVDIAAEPEVKLWDLAPLDILVREAGGAFTNLAGAAGPHGGNAVATNGLLHDAVLAGLSGV